MKQGQATLFILIVVVIVGAIAGIYFVLQGNGIEEEFHKEVGEIPYYFIVLHAEDGGFNSANVGALINFIDKANDYNMKISLQFNPDWAAGIFKNSTLMGYINTWRGQGHEIGAHHHSIYHPGGWNGYSDYPEDEAWEIMGEYSTIVYGYNNSALTRNSYRGNMDNFMEVLMRINPTMNSGCATGAADWTEMPKEIIYDSCPKYLTHGPVGEIIENVHDPANGINEYVVTADIEGVKRRWVNHASVIKEKSIAEAIDTFDSMSSGVYGIATHVTTKPGERPSPGTDYVGSQIGYLEIVMDYFHEQDPIGTKSLTLKEAITTLGLPEYEIEPFICGDGTCVDDYEYKTTCPADC